MFTHKMRFGELVVPLTYIKHVLQTMNRYSVSTRSPFLKKVGYYALRPSLMTALLCGHFRTESFVAFDWSNIVRAGKLRR